MADLSALIRLHKHELDEKRRALGELYGEMAVLERELRDLETAFEREKDSMAAEGGVYFTFAGYVEKVRARKEEIAKEEEALEERIEAARDDMMETFAELKKFEKAQEARERAEQEKRAMKEAQALDEIGLENYRRKEEEG
ncbi:MAG: flagellar FliJ family protein [Alphaproteobacteria bacterium]|nr:flagellar FliJ family protein [Alphaproteobacteria bacterium]